MKKIVLILVTVIVACSSFQKKKIKKPTAAPISSCMQKKIDAYKKMEMQDRPQRVVEYMYNGKKVYYVLAHCCDFPNELYDSNCNKLGEPDGGFTGRGDGKFPDFAEKRTKERVLWKNE